MTCSEQTVALDQNILLVLWENGARYKVTATCSVALVSLFINILDNPLLTSPIVTVMQPIQDVT